MHSGLLEPHEVPRVSEAFCDDRARRVFLTLALTGLRRSEVVGLRWRHINLVEGTLRVEESKSEEGERLIALPDSLVDEFAAHFAGSVYRSDEDYVFCHPERGTKLDGDGYRDAFRAALASAGVEGHVRTFHDMRYTAITNLAATGASPIAVMATAGHRSMQTTKGCLHLAGVVFRDEAQALERRLLGRTQLDDECEHRVLDDDLMDEPAAAAPQLVADSGNVSKADDLRLRRADSRLIEAAGSSIADSHLDEGHHVNRDGTSHLSGYKTPGTKSPEPAALSGEA